MKQQARRFIYRRPEVANDFVSRITGEHPLHQDSCLFLTGPRRTGKTTMLRTDLMPALDEKGIIPVYVDLWSDPDEHPGKLISAAICRETDEHRNILNRGMKAIGLRRISAEAGVGVDFEFDPDQAGIGLPGLLETLAEKSDRPVALIVDEAQHAISSKEGMATMFALKSARDTMNAGEEETRLHLIFTGSHRDKLGRLVLSKNSPFYGSSVTNFPVLGREYVEAHVGWINERLSSGMQYDADLAYEAFLLLGNRPEYLQQLLRDLPFNAGAVDRSTVMEAATRIRDDLWNEYEMEFDSLTPLQQAVFLVMLHYEEGMSPFTAGSLSDYSRALGAPVESSGAQAAIEALRAKSLIWRSARGHYTLENQDMIAWMRHREAAGAPLAVRIDEMKDVEVMRPLQAPDRGRQAILIEDRRGKDEGSSPVPPASNDVQDPKILEAEILEPEIS